ncbi:MAG: AraC family transcriptional regulator [Myxococcota bacterium]
MIERITFRHGPILPGVEVLDAENSSRNWRWLNTGYSLAFSTSWVGQVQYRQHRLPVTPGTVFCSAPGEIHTTPRVDRCGTFHVLLFDADVFQTLARKLGSTTEVTWGPIVDNIAPTLGARALSVIRDIDTTSESLSLQSRLAEFFGDIAESLFEVPVSLRAARGIPRRAARIREVLHDGSPTTDLMSLAKEAGLDRFQTLRVFKRTYGITPYAYQVCLRISRARELLKQGFSPAAVAAECDFADQSHLGRHFKRLVGVTPGQYKREPYTGSTRTLESILGQPDR